MTTEITRKTNLKNYLEANRQAAGDPDWIYTIESYLGDGPEPPRFLLIESSRYDSSIWFSLHESADEAGHQFSGQEHPEDFEPRLIDLDDTTREFYPEIHVTFKEFDRA